ncbi:MAG: YggS family pyridoxal phosphate-dependent enzyme [Lachnospiraceae bacterium]|nr:YggS family pyridoxal phosphate-dependent enzyme [Lachnospiraceae bacterium]
MLRENYEAVDRRVAEACRRAGRDRSEVTLVAVSKTKPATDILEVYQSGVRDFGENKVQELTEKYGVLPDDIRWHLIGHLQRNKVKYLPGKTCLIHSVDSLRLAMEIETIYAAADMECDILLEVNVAEEESKYGVKASEVYDLAKQIAELPHVHIRGLMTIAPYTEDPESNRKYFRELRQLAVDIQSKKPHNICMDELSMGMTGDFEVAIEEGATIVRVGTGIFGERNYNIN